MSEYKSFKSLAVWNKAMDLTDEVYKLVKLFPKEETYCLSDQLRRAVISIPSNIAEGYKRNSDKEYIQFLSIANGSCAEVETQILIAIRQNIITAEEAGPAMALIDEIPRMLNSLIKKIKLRSQL